MAEERLIDDDKDRKYKIRRNSDGEDELYVDDSVVEGEEPAEEEVMFEVEEVSEDDEEAAVMTPEQLAAKREREEKERAEREAKIASLLSSADSDFKAEKYATALEYLEEVTAIDENNGEAYAMRLAIYTKNYTDYTQVGKAAEVADDVKEYSSPEARAAAFEIAHTSLEELIGQYTEKVEELNRENESGKAERAKKFKKDRKVALIIFAVTLVVFFACLATVIYFAVMLNTVADDSYKSELIGSGVACGIFLVGTLFCTRRVLTACRRVRLNKRNSATKLGRELTTTQTELAALKRIYEALKVEN